MDREQETLCGIDDLPEGSTAGEGAKLENLIYDTFQACWWNMETFYPHKEVRAVNALINSEHWPKIEYNDKKTGEKLLKTISPADYTSMQSKGQTVDNTTWLPGYPKIVRDKLSTTDGYIFDSPGNRMFNLYRAPPPCPVSAGDPSFWVDHVKFLWPNPKDHEYFFDYCAHMLQRPQEKCNAMIVLSGKQGIGKDFTLRPLKAAIGPYNVKDISPDQLVANFDPWKQCIMLTVNEMHTIAEDITASKIYDTFKNLAAAPPDMLLVRDKHMKDRYVANVLRIFAMTNHMITMYMDKDDRRMFILHSTQSKRDTSYFNSFGKWLDNGGNEAVAYFLHTRDISKFETRQAPHVTAGKAAVLDSWEKDDAISAALERLKRPPVFFSVELNQNSFDDGGEILAMLKGGGRRLIHRMKSENYFAIHFKPSLEFNGKSRKTFRLAFCSEELMGNEGEIDRLTRQRGQMLADEIPQLVAKAF